MLLLISQNGMPADSIEKTSKLYVYDKNRSYFEQCFREVRVLGRGLFGEILPHACRFVRSQLRAYVWEPNMSPATRR
ncbi:unnamed protein product [Cylicocyclus nassatus]|uniref:Uncharacterized protein n=1 Tax=Cylicocyclus nassatus TaxID=53992 RepID=A0AA36GUR2_CYLNA|nr:unnamed protein product [Cylicocyclus nassatus]